MLKKKLLLAVTAIVLLFGFFLLPKNREWSQRVIDYYNEFTLQQKNPSREYRMSFRFGNSYTHSKSIADLVAHKDGGKPALVLVPSTAYFKKSGINYEVPEPAVFYYYTGCKTIAPASVDAIHANWYARAEGKNIIVDRVTDRKALQDTIAAFNKWK